MLVYASAVGDKLAAKTGLSLLSALDSVSRWTPWVATIKPAAARPAVDLNISRLNFNFILICDDLIAKLLVVRR